MPNIRGAERPEQRAKYLARRYLDTQRALEDAEMAASEARRAFWESEGRPGDSEELLREAAKAILSR